MLTQRKIKQLISYDRLTGIVRNRKTNQVVGGQSGRKYPQIIINGKHYLLHRLIWLYVYGSFPKKNIDHINRDPSDNRLSNLRNVSQICNMRNVANFKHGTSGVKGVNFHKPRNKWRAVMVINQVKKSLGYYQTFDNAVCARLAGEQCVDWSGCDSNSPAFQYVKENIQNKQSVESLNLV